MSLRLLTYNILDGGAGREQIILKVLNATQPDIAVLQEVVQPRVAEELAEALNMEFCFARGNSVRHLAMLSRLPIVGHYSYHPSPPIHTTVLEAMLEYAPNQLLRVYGVHLIAGPSVVFELWRQWEVKAILRRVEPHRSSPCLIAGDFNAIAPHDPVALKSWPRCLKLMLALQGGHVFRRVIRTVLLAGFTDCYRILHSDEDGFTLPTPAPNSRLDYIFVNDSLKNCLRRCSVVTEPTAVEQGSDHYPVVAEFDL